MKTFTSYSATQPIASHARIRAFFVGSILASCLALPATAAVDVNITVSAGGGTISTYSNVHRSQATPDPGTAATGGFAVDITSVNGTTVNVAPHATFCTELSETVSFTSYTTYAIDELRYASAGTAGRPGTASASIPLGGIGAQSAADLRYLFDQYYFSENIASWTAMESQAFQLAIWEVAHDLGNFSLAGGNFSVGAQSDSSLTPRVARAQTMLTTLDNANVTLGYQSSRVLVWALVDDNGINSTTGYQDLLFATIITGVDKDIVPLLPVPEPSSMALLAVGAMGIFLSGRNRRRTA